MPPSVKSSSDAQFRSSQRTSRRCTECARRKTKCSLEIPCSACVQRGITDKCQREIVRVGGRLMGGDTILSSAQPRRNTSTSISTSPSASRSSVSLPPAEVAILRARVQELQTSLDDLLQQRQQDEIQQQQSRQQEAQRLQQQHGEEKQQQQHGEEQQRPLHQELQQQHHHHHHHHHDSHSFDLLASVPDNRDVFTEHNRPNTHSQSKFIDPRAGPGRSEDRALLHPQSTAVRYAPPLLDDYRSQFRSLTSPAPDDISQWSPNSSRPVGPYAPSSTRNSIGRYGQYSSSSPSAPSCATCERCRKHNLQCNGRPPCTSCSAAGVASCSFDPFKSISQDDLTSHLMDFRALINVLTTIEDPSSIIQDLKRGIAPSEIVQRYHHWNTRERPRWD